MQLITSVQIRCTDSNPSGAGPDVSGCSGLYGTVIRPPCEVALDGLPTGSLPTIFTTKTRIAGGNFVTLPKRYVDSDRPSCAITIDLDGHSQKDIFVLVPWNAIRRIVENILDDCVDRNFWGGFQTFGLQRSFDAFVESASRVKDSPPYAQVEQPDGAVDTSVVAMPQKTPPKSLGECSFRLKLRFCLQPSKRRSSLRCMQETNSDGRCTSLYGCVCIRSSYKSRQREHRLFHRAEPSRYVSPPLQKARCLD